MLKPLVKYLYFARTERRGLQVVIVLIGIVLTAPYVMRYFYRQPQTDFSAIEQHIQRWQVSDAIAAAAEVPTAELFHFDPNTASVETLVHLGVPPRVAQTIQRYRERGGRFRTADDLGKIYTLPREVFERLQPYVRIGRGESITGRRNTDQKRQPPAELFSFDPNTAPKEDLLRLGLHPALVERLLKYREKGGVFRQKSDFQKLYGLSEESYARLEPYIVVTESIRPAVYSGGTASKGAYQPGPIDINTANAEQWMSLPGIGSARARNILQYRERLGGFLSVDQVAETFNLPDSTFQQIKPWLRLETPIYRKVNLNVATERDLSAHPYINYQQARLIVAYREQHGAYKRPDDIRRIHVFSDLAWLERVIPYLEAN